MPNEACILEEEMRKETKVIIKQQWIVELERVSKCFEMTGVHVNHKAECFLVSSKKPLEGCD